MPGHVRIQRFKSRPKQITHALLLPEHPKLFMIDWNAIIQGLGITTATELWDQMVTLNLFPEPGTWLLLEGDKIIGWASSMDDMDPV